MRLAERGGFAPLFLQETEPLRRRQLRLLLLQAQREVQTLQQLAAAVQEEIIPPAPVRRRARCLSRQGRNGGRQLQVRAARQTIERLREHAAAERLQLKRGRRQGRPLAATCRRAVARAIARLEGSVAL